MKKNETDVCPLCNKGSDTTEHVLLICPHKKMKDMRDTVLNEILKLYPDFKELNYKSKLCTILNLYPFDNSVDKAKFIDVCIHFTSMMMKCRFENE